MGHSPWRKVAGALLIGFAHAGLGFYSMGLFLKPLEATFGWSRTSTGALATIFFIVGAVASPLVGRGVDKYGARRIILASALVMAAGLLLLSLTGSLPHFYAGGIVYAAGLAGIGPLTASAIVSLAFREKRGLAMGIALTGVGLGALFLAPVLAYLIATLGWRRTYVVMAVLAVAITAIASLLLKDSSPLKGRHSTKPVSPEKATLGGHTVARALASPAFWLVTIAFTGAIMGSVIVLLNLVVYLTDREISGAVASSALGLTAGMGAVGKVVFGYLADRAPKTYAAAIAFLLQALGILLLMQAHSMWGVWAFVVVYGFGLGGNVTLLPLLLGEYFGLAFFATIYGTSFIMMSLGNAAAPLVTGLIYDTTKSYLWIFIFGLVVYGVATIAALALSYYRAPVPRARAVKDATT